MTTTPRSLYIHIPFCTRKCRYCDFYSIPYNEQLADRYIKALVFEMESVCNDHGFYKPVFDTVYYGGGTPSLLSEKQWYSLYESLSAIVTFSKNCEWTVECNPDSFSNKKASCFLNTGVTRITFGTQSLNDRELSFMGRIHSSKHVKKVLNGQSLTSFQSVGADLIYGVPGQTLPSLRVSLDYLLNHSILKHISVYELSLNKNTPFGKHQSILPLPNEDLLYDMAITIFEMCRSSGFEQYEISNFAQPGHQCAHNKAYWNHDNYIGLGCGAHSYIHPFRYANHNDIISYIESSDKRIIPKRNREYINAEILAREMIFLGIRRNKGINEIDFKQKTGFDFKDYADNQILARLLENEYLTFKDNHWVPTEKGILIADAIARDLIRCESTE